MHKLKSIDKSSFIDYEPTLQKCLLDYDVFMDTYLPVTWAPLPQCFHLRRRLYLGMMLGCFVLVRVTIYLHLVLGNAHSCVWG
jgi:hypothetical protein